MLRLRNQTGFQCSPIFLKLGQVIYPSGALFYSSLKKKTITWPTSWGCLSMKRRQCVCFTVLEEFSTISQCCCVPLSCSPIMYLDILYSVPSTGLVSRDIKRDNTLFLPLNTFDFPHIMLCDSAEVLLTTFRLKHFPGLFRHQGFKLCIHHVAHLCNEHVHSSSRAFRSVQPELSLWKVLPSAHRETSRTQWDHFSSLLLRLCTKPAGVECLCLWLRSRSLTNSLDLWEM